MQGRRRGDAWGDVGETQGRRREYNYFFCGGTQDISDITYKLYEYIYIYIFKYFYCISSDFSDLPDMTDEYIDLSVYALTGWLLYILHLTYIQK